MSQPKRKLPLYTSPKGRFLYPKLVVPDTKFDKEGRLSVGLLLTAKAAEAQINKLAPVHQAAIDEAEAVRAEKIASLPPAKQKLVKPIDVNPFFHEDLDKETGEPTGDLLFRFSTKATGVSRKKGVEEKFTRRIAIFDAMGKPIVDPKLEIWSGTVGKVTFVAVPYYVPATGATGLSMRPVAVQVIELRTRGQGRDASAFGFGEEDGGYEYEAADPSESGAEETKGTESEAVIDDDEIPF